MAARAKNRKTFKRLLLLNQFIDFEIMIQECSLGDCLPKLLKPSASLKQHGPGKTLLLSFHIENVEKDDLSLIFPLLRLLRYGEKDGPEFFLVTFVSSGVITLSVFSIRYFRYADFYMDQEKPCYFRFILKMF